MENTTGKKFGGRQKGIINILMLNNLNLIILYQLENLIYQIFIIRFICINNELLTIL